MTRRAFALLLVVVGCRQADSVVVVRIETVDVTSPIHQLRTTLGNAGAQDVRRFPDRPAAVPIAFPTSFALVLARSRSGDLRVQVDGLDPGARLVATGEASGGLDVGGRVEITVVLRPSGSPQDGGTDGGPDVGDGPPAEMGGEGADRAEPEDGGVDVADTNDSAAEALDGLVDKPIELAEAPAEPSPEPPVDMSPDVGADLSMDLSPDAAVDPPLDAPPADLADAPTDPSFDTPTPASWTNRTPASTKPAGRSDFGMAYDAARARIVIFGGSSSTCPSSKCADVWEWDGATATWADRSPPTLPPVWPSGRVNHAMTYDTGRGKIVLFGGESTTCSECADTWEWDGGDGTWIDRTPSGTKPSVRYRHAMSFDAARGKAVMFGGRSGATAYQDTWEWDGAAGTWTDRTPASVNPPPRYRHAMAFDQGRARLVVFGGFDGFSVLFDDTWEWNGAAGTWTKIAPALKPSKREQHAMAFDSKRGTVVLFGGFDGVVKQDTWEWDGAAMTWTEQTLPTGNPPARFSHAMATDVGRSAVLMFGGSAGGAGSQSSWEWRGP